MRILSCPFTFTFTNPAHRVCVGEKCINFEWRTPGFNIERGVCLFFNQQTGHQRDYWEEKP